VIRKVPIRAEIRGSTPRALPIGCLRMITTVARIARYPITDSRIAMFTEYTALGSAGSASRTY
jgi:hypothetical protein